MDQKVISVNETQMCRRQIRAAIPPKYSGITPKAGSPGSESFVLKKD